MADQSGDPNVGCLVVAGIGCLVIGVAALLQGDVETAGPFIFVVAIGVLLLVRKSK